MKFTDGLKSLISGLINLRDATTQNIIHSPRVDYSELREIYRSGIGNKIVRLKSGYALNDTIKFSSEEDKKYYNAKLAKPLKEVTKWMLSFGRGIIIVHTKGTDLSEPRTGPIDQSRAIISVFSGDIAKGCKPGFDLQGDRYMIPNNYNVRGHNIHHSHVVDFTYVKPPELEAPGYFWGGISEFELIYEQLINDGVMQRACPKMVEKAATLFYKIKGFKDLLATGKEKELVQYVSGMESVRGINSAGLMDADDELQVVTQTLANIGDADQITLKRLAMVTGISRLQLIGESGPGMNNTTEGESQTTLDMVKELQDNCILSPMNQLFSMLGMGEMSFMENQGETPTSRVTYDGLAVKVAADLDLLGEDSAAYLKEKGVVIKNEADWFGDA